MPRKRHTPEEIVAKLRQVDVMTAQGRTVVEAVKSIGVTEVTLHRWRKLAVFTLSGALAGLAGALSCAVPTSRPRFSASPSLTRSPSSTACSRNVALTPPSELRSQRHDVGSGWINDSLDQLSEPLKRLSFFLDEGVAVIDASHAGDHMAKHALGMIHRHTCAAHERPCRSPQVVDHPWLQLRGRIGFAQASQHFLV